MRLQQAMDRVDEMRPNMQSRELKIAWLSELDGLIHKEIILKHEHTTEQETFSGYTEDTDPDTDLLAPWPYDEMYTYWLMARIDELNQETDKYNADRAKFENAYGEMQDWWNRTYMPVCRNRQLWI